MGKLTNQSYRSMVKEAKEISKYFTVGVSKEYKINKKFAYCKALELVKSGYTIRYGNIEQIY